MGRTILVDRDAAVLVVQSRVDKERLLRRIEPAFLRKVRERDQVLVQHSGLLPLEPRRIQKHADLSVALHGASFGALSQDRSGDDIARLQLVDETLAPAVDELG